MSDIKSILEGYAPKADFASAINSCPRTVDNYRKLPDGLPSLTIAGKVYIPIDLGRQWIERRLVTPNPTRKAG
jgi:hypothetical protein